MTRLARAQWMTAPETVTLMRALGDARFVGGVVRNALLEKPVSDIDIATPHEPAAVCALLQAAGIKTVPTGIEHGTITAVVDGKPFEVTSLRRDVATDGRRAVVAFTTDWARDAERRDFTMNALYAATDGEVFDFVGGLADLAAGRVRFVGDPVRRIREDYLRILRLFRFHAWYGTGPLDAAALAAAEQEKKGLGQLSGERIAKEMLKFLAADSPLDALSAMHRIGVLDALIPGAAELQPLADLVAADATFGFAPDAILRLAALLPPDRAAAQEVAARWKLSHHDRDRLSDLADGGAAVAPDLAARGVGRLLYTLGPQRFCDRVRLAWSRAPHAAAQWRGLLAAAQGWQRPQFPLTGSDVLAAGVAKGPAIGQVLGEVESWWIDNGFPPDAESLHHALQAALQKVR